MSQVTYNNNGVPPPSVATSYVTDNGTAVPAANILLVNGKTSTENNNNGVITKGGVVGTGTSNELDVTLTNRLIGTATTTDDVTTQTVYTFSLGSTPATFILDVKVVGFNVTDSLSAGYSSVRVIRTDGVTATLISANPVIVSEETTMIDVVVVNDVSGNNAILTVNGLAGKTIHWRALTTYLEVT